MSKVQGLLDEELPREKLIKFGPQALTEVELLAIILRVGTKNKNVLELSREIIEKFSINLVSRKTYDELLEFRGINKAKATQIVSVFELSRRLSFNVIKKDVKITSSKHIFELTQQDFNSLTKERVIIVYVDSKNQVIKKDILFEGSINYSIIEPREIIKRVLSLDASGFFLLHNHPSGDTTPSQDDINITKKIKSICDKMNIRFLDHLIVSDNNYYSLYDSDNL